MGERAAAPRSDEMTRVSNLNLRENGKIVDLFFMDDENEKTTVVVVCIHCKAWPEGANYESGLCEKCYPKKCEKCYPR